MVPRPPTLNTPNRAKGADTVTMLGVTARITLTTSGWGGISFLTPLIFVSFVIDKRNELRR